MAHLATLFQACTGVKKVDVCSYELHTCKPTSISSHTCRRSGGLQPSASESTRTHWHPGFIGNLPSEHAPFVERVLALVIARSAHGCRQQIAPSIAIDPLLFTTYVHSSSPGAHIAAGPGA